MPSTFAEEKDNILSWYILHHAVDDRELQELSTRLSRAVETADRLHAGSLRKTGEPYIYHPLRTAMEVSRFGRIVDWPSIEAAILHDTIEDTDYSPEELKRDFPESAELVEALTKIKDDKGLSYRRLFEYALKDIRVLLIKIADRVDNLSTLHIFSPEKRLRIARESATMYANTCERLCMLDLAGRLREQVGEYLTPEKFAEFQEAQKRAKKELERPLVHLRSRLAEVFPGDLTVRIDIQWNRFDHNLPVTTENLFTVRIITESREAAYQALGRIHIAFPALAGGFKDNVSNPRENGYRALETLISNRGMIVRFYIASREDDRYNRLGLLSMDIESAHFNTRYLKDLREFLEAEDYANIQDYLRFNLPDGIQVTTPKGETLNLEVGATALDFAFALHKELGLRATGAVINDIPTTIGTKLKMNDRVVIRTADRPVCNAKYLQWATTRRAMSAIKRYLRQEELRKAVEEGKKLLLGVGTAGGMDAWEIDSRVKSLAAQTGEKTDKIYEEVFFGKVPLEKVLGPQARPGWNPVSALLQKVMPQKPAAARTVRRYDFGSSNLRFCPVCVPVMGDDIEGVAGERVLTVHRKGCVNDDAVPRVPVEWDRQKKIELRDPGQVRLELETSPVPGLLYRIMAPFRALEIEINSMGLPGEDNIFHLEFRPGTARALDRLLRDLRKLDFVKKIELGHSEETR